MAGSEKKGKKRRPACGRDDGRSRRPRPDWDAGSAHALAVGAQGYDLLQQTERTLRLIDHIATNTCEKAMWEQIAYLPCQLFAGHHAQQMMTMQREMQPHYHHMGSMDFMLPTHLLELSSAPRRPRYDRRHEDGRALCRRSPRQGTGWEHVQVSFPMYLQINKNWRKGMDDEMRTRAVLYEAGYRHSDTIGVIADSSRHSFVEFTSRDELDRACTELLALRGVVVSAEPAEQHNIFVRKRQRSRRGGARNRKSIDSEAPQKEDRAEQQADEAPQSPQRADDSDDDGSVERHSDRGDDD